MNAVDCGILAVKVGMTQIFDNEGNLIPVTVLDAGSNKVVAKKSMEVDGYCAVQVGIGSKSLKNETKAMKTHLAKSGIDGGFYRIKEIRLNEDENIKIGQSLSVTQFLIGDKVNVQGATKGRGFTGTVKRYGFTIGPLTHGSKKHRRVGSIGSGTSPGKVFKGKKMPGHHGNVFRTVMRLAVVGVDTEKNLLFVKGAVPGAPKGFVRVTKLKEM